MARLGAFRKRLRTNVFAIKVVYLSVFASDWLQATVFLGDSAKFTVRKDTKMVATQQTPRLASMMWFNRWFIGKNSISVY